MEIISTNGENEEKDPKSIVKIVSKIAALTLIVYFVILFGVRSVLFLNPGDDSPSKKEKIDHELSLVLDEAFPRRNQILSSLPYNTVLPELSVLAESAICIDASNGCVVYEKNADEVIPPASMTKLFQMYVVFREIEKGTVSLDDVIPIVPEAYACNMMPHSSLMFLGKNQVVTLDELLTGLSVCSGNDASYAIAYHLYGSMDKFIEKMNEEAKNLGLKNTHFVESSGYSEENVTTAREMAAFSREYIMRFPESLKYHSVDSFAYPKEKNLAPEDRGKERTQDFTEGFPEHITMEILQNNTNPLLPVLDGCDGIKTGYIDESGYNLSLTAMREGVRFISVTMKGPGSNTKEGQAGRVHDGTEIMEWAFKTFTDYRYDFGAGEKLAGNENVGARRRLGNVGNSSSPEFKVPVLGPSSTYVKLKCAYVPETLTVPKTIAQNQYHAEKEVVVKNVVPPYIKGPVKAGEAYGYIEVSLGSYVLEKIPLVSDRSLENAPFFLRIADFFVEALGSLKW